MEDCAQAHGAEYERKKVGSFGVGCFSFYATKNIVTGEGGMITTSSSEVAKLCRMLRNHGENGKYNHVILGYNFRMTNIQAAIGIAELRKLDWLNEAPIKNAEFLNKKLKKSGLRVPTKKSNVKHVYHQYAVLVEEDFPMSRDELAEYLKNEGIECAIHYPKPIFEQPLYRNLGYGDERCPIAKEISRKILSLPVHPGLSKDDLEYIVETINSV